MGRECVWHWRTRQSLADDTSAEPLTRRVARAARPCDGSGATAPPSPAWWCSALIVLMALAAPWLAPYNPNALNPVDSLQPPSA